jgi:uncharacterized Ntn-hydrolase superfamily protein
MKQKLLMVTLLLLISVAGPSCLFATWSIIAVDHATAEVGAAGASFTPAVYPILGIVGGRGAIVAQAATNLEAKRLGMLLLQDEVSPEEIRERITDPAFDPSVQRQQYGIVTLYDGSAGFTGTQCMNWAGQIGNDTVMIQGNFLVGEEVINRGLAAYNAALERGAPLAERLVEAMVAASEVGGDRRGGDVPAMTAFLAIAAPADPPGRASHAVIVTPQRSGVNPIAVLAESYYEKSDQLPPARFPVVLRAAIVVFGLPFAIGVVVGLLLLFLVKMLSSRTRTTMALVLASASALLSYAMVRAAAGLLHYVIPFYGFFQTIGILALVITPPVVVALVVGVRAVYRHVAAR